MGVYTSRLVSTLERIQVNGNRWPSGRPCVWSTHSGPRLVSAPTHFETFTLLAFSYFAQRAVDYAVVEAGVGGTYDATNVVQPTVAIVTDVGLDHTDLLGRTKPLIARDKQGIIKPGCIGLTGSRFVKRGTYIPLDRAVIHHTSLTGTDFSYKGLKHLQLSALGQHRNAILAIETAQRLGIASQARIWFAPGSNRGASKSFPNTHYCGWGP